MPFYYKLRHWRSDSQVKKEAKEFYCPMKCEGEKTYSENKGCPKCGMALVEKKAKKEEGDHSGHKH